MKKALSAVALILFTLISAQELKTISFNVDNINKSQIKISKNWTSAIQNKTLTISNGSVTNQTTSSSGRLKIEYYLSPGVLDLSSQKFEGFLIADTPLRSIDRNTSSVGVIIKNTVNNLPPEGSYNPVLVLTNNSGNILDIIQLNGSIIIENGVISKEKIDQPSETKIDEKESKADKSGITDLNTPIKLNVNLDNSISLEKEWKINIDFKNFMVDLKGGDIANNTTQDSKNLIIDVYLSKGEAATLTSNFEGIHIAKAPLNPILKSKRAVGASIKTNLRAIPPQGTYHIIMTLSEVDDSGKAVVKNTKSFQNAVTL